MKVRVRGFLTVREVLGGRKTVTLEVKEATVAELLCLNPLSAPADPERNLLLNHQLGIITLLKSHW